MFSKITGSIHKLGKLIHIIIYVSLATLALVIIGAPTSPAAAADPQPQAVLDAPNATCPPDGQCFADVPPSSSFYTFTNRIFQQNLVTGFPCGGSGEPCDANQRPYYRPVNNVTRQQMAKFIDNARRLSQIYIEAPAGVTAIYAASQSGDTAIEGSSNSGYGVYGNSPTGSGVFGTTAGGNGVGGNAASSGDGVHGTANTGNGVYGRSTGTGGGVMGVGGTGPGVNGYSSTGNGVVGFNSAGTGYGVYGYSGGFRAGYFSGSVEVTGNISKGGGSFKIDDPLDPANKYLYHSFVESPDMMNVYNGNITTDDKGDATVQLPNYFEVLNKDFRYQLTVMGQFAQAIVSQKVEDNRFTIKTDKPNVEVSWQVTGIRQDPYANAHRIPIEEDKPADEKGKYLHPTEWGQPASMGVDYEQQQEIEQAAQAQSKP